MSFKLLALLSIMAVANTAMGNRNLMCACCSDDPPERCSEMRFNPPCENAQFQAMCAGAPALQV